MRVIEASGGLELGPAGGPQLDMIPIPECSRVMALSDIEVLCRGAGSQWVRSPRDAPIPLDGGWAILATDHTHSCVLRYMRPGKMSDVEALRIICEHEPELGPAIVGGVLAAATGLRKLEQLSGVGPAIIAHCCGLSPQQDTGESLNAAQIAGLAHRLPDSFAEPETVIDIPAGRVDRARYWLAVARELWQPAALARIGKTGPIAIESGMLAGELAMAFVILHDVESIRISDEVSVLLPQDIVERGVAWPQALELAAASIGKDALQWMTGGRLHSAQATIDQAFTDESDVPRYPDAALARGLAAEFLRDAEENAHYAAMPPFEILIDSDLHLAAWGVTSLKIWPAADHMWVGVMAEQGLSVIVQWRPQHNGGLRHWCCDDRARPMLHCTLAALWRDMRCAGPDVLVDAAAPRQAVTNRDRPGPDRQPRRRYVQLPRQRKIQLKRWASETERDSIQRRLHGVRPHLMKLRAGMQPSAEALETAGHYGIPVPAGYTFRRAHTRGQDLEASTGGAVPVRVRARGLLALKLLLGG